MRQKKQKKASFDLEQLATVLSASMNGEDGDADDDEEDDDNDSDGDDDNTDDDDDDEDDDEDDTDNDDGTDSDREINYKRIVISDGKCSYTSMHVACI